MPTVKEIRVRLLVLIHLDEVKKLLIIKDGMMEDLKLTANMMKIENEPSRI